MQHAIPKNSFIPNERWFPSQAGLGQRTAVAAWRDHLNALEAHLDDMED
jgi:hypothetical protein